MIYKSREELFKMHFLGGHGEYQFYKEWGGGPHWTLVTELR